MVCSYSYSWCMHVLLCLFWFSLLIMEYGSSPYIGMAPKKMAALLYIVSCPDLCSPPAERSGYLSSNPGA